MTRQFDIAITGAGLGGATAAAMLGRAGRSVALIDPFERFRPDFRCEKLEEGHVAALRRAGLADGILPVTRPYRGICIARRGRVVECRDAVEYGIEYSRLVNRMRDLVPRTVTRLVDKVVDVAPSEDRQTVTLGSGETLSARLVVAANGLNTGILDRLGVRRRVISAQHSLSFGFEVVPTGAGPLPFAALTHFGEDPGQGVGYLTLFPMGGSLRANLFVYRPLSDPWLRRFRDEPEAVLAEALPGLHRTLGSFRVAGSLRPRPVDVAVSEDLIRPGVVLIGDAFGTVCPASGTGAMKALVDAERLCNAYVPRWLETPGMPAVKVAGFYADPAKRRMDAHALHRSLSARRIATDRSPLWAALRWARYAGSVVRGTFAGQHVHEGAPAGLTHAGSL